MPDSPNHSHPPASPNRPRPGAPPPSSRPRLRFLLALALSWLGSVVLARNQPAIPDYSVRVWRLEDGLPVETITALHQARDGSIWLGSDAGAVRFDGIRFDSIDTRPPSAVPLSRISHISEDASGRIWFATAGGGVVCKDGPNLTHYGPAQGLSNEQAKIVAHGPSGNLWVGTDGGGLFEWTGSRFQSIPPPNPLARFIVGIAETDGHQVLVATPKDGIWRWDRNSWSRVPTAGSDLPPQWNLLVRSKSGTIRAGGSEGLWEFRGDRFDRVRWQPDERFSVRTLLETGPDELWIGTPEALLHRQGDRFESLKVGAGFSNRGTTTLLRDFEGSLWAATDGLGLAQLQRNRFKSIGTPEGLSHDEVTSVCESSDGSVWVTTASGLNHLHSTGITHFSRTNGLPDNFLFSAHEDPSGRLWLGTRTAGLVRFEHGRFTQVPLPDQPDRLAVWCIAGNHSNTLWVGTPTGLTVIADGQPMLRLAGKDGLSNDDVRSICPGKNGDLWVGTSFGLNLIRNNQVITNWSSGAGQPMETVVSLHHDPDGTLWIGTLDRGLFRWRDGRFSHLSTQQGLIEDSIHQIIDDHLGNLWFTCSRGVFSIPRESLHSAADRQIVRMSARHYTVADGLRSLEFTSSVQPAGTRTRDGQLWFPSNRGISIVNPSRIHQRPPPPSPRIDRIVVHGERSSLGIQLRDHGPDWSPPTGSRIARSSGNPGSLPHLDILEPGAAVRFPPDADFLEIHFTAPSFVAPRHLKFRCQLVGFDRGWIEMGERRVAYYTRVPPGRYLFRVAAENHEGVVSPTHAEVELVLLPHWYQTLWFFFALATLAALAIVGSYFWRERHLSRRRIAQESFARQLIASQELERRRIASDLHDSLEQELLVIKNRADLALDSSSPAQSHQQLGEISQLAMHAIEAVREITHNLRPKILDRLGLTRALRTLVERIQDSATLQVHADLDPIDGLLPNPDEINLYRIVQESLNNVLKHSGASRVEIHLHRHPSEITLEIQDNGRGFSTESDLATGGFGLRSLRERARILGGSLDVHSEPGHGTSVHAHFPIRNQSPTS